MSSLQLLYESGPCYVFYKPAGLSTQSPPGIDSMEVRIKDWLRQRENKEGNVYLGMPHRLDRPVSGALVVARHVRACRKLSEQFEDRLVRKVYWAAVSGNVEPAAGRWVDWLRKIPGQAHVEVVERDHPEAMSAVLNYRTLGTFAGGTCLEIELETGRTHQIRVQTSTRGYPILGDEQYGSTSTFGPATDDPRQRTIALHGRHLDFRHPMTQEPVQVIAPLPEAWCALGLAGLSDAEHLTEQKLKAES